MATATPHRATADVTHPHRRPPRRAALADVPAIGRLLDLPRWSPKSDDRVSDSILRLVLAHSIPGRAQIWVQDAEGGLRSAVALLPPMDVADPRDIAWDINLQLGVGLPAHNPRLRSQLGPSWLLLSPRGSLPGAGLQDVAGLLKVALRGVDASRAPVVAFAPQRDPGLAIVLSEAGFVPGAIDGTLLRPVPVSTERAAGVGWGAWTSATSATRA